MLAPIRGVLGMRRARHVLRVLPDWEHLVRLNLPVWCNGTILCV